MALGARLARLERARRHAPPPACDACGAALGWVPTMEVWNDAGEVLTPRCAACGFGLDTTGKPMFALPPGSERKVIVLDRLPAW